MPIINGISLPVPISPAWRLSFSNQTTTFYGRAQPGSDLEGAQFGCYHALIESRIPFEIVDDSFLDSLARFRVLILPNIAALSDAQCRQLTESVRQGGRIVATHETSLYDEWGVHRQDFGLSELFGCSYGGSIAVDGQHRTNLALSAEYFEVL